MHLATERGARAAGGLFDWVTVDHDGVRITDVWDSRKQCLDFAQQQIGPVTAEVGLLGPPKVTIYDIHNYLTAGE